MLAALSRVVRLSDLPMLLLVLSDKLLDLLVTEEALEAEDTEELDDVATDEALEEGDTEAELEVVATDETLDEAKHGLVTELSGR